METKKKPSAALEFLVIVLLLVFAVIFAWNVNVDGLFNKLTNATPSKAVQQQEQQTATADNKWKAGKDLYRANCASCHNTKTEGTGPALIGVRNRWQAAGSYKGKTGEQWLHEWVKNWHNPVDQQYKYAVDMANTRPAQMNIFPYLSDDDIDQIFNFVDSTSVPVVSASVN